MIDILLVEDDPVAGYAISTLLSLGGYRLEIASTVEQARILAARKPRAVVLDLMLPDGSGEDLIGTILAANPECWVIVWTGCPLTDGRKEAIKAKGAKAVLTKPLSHMELVAELPPPMA